MQIEKLLHQHFGNIPFEIQRTSLRKAFHGWRNQELQQHIGFIVGLKYIKDFLQIHLRYAL